MGCMLLAELAILCELNAVRIVLLILVGAIIAVLALRASQRDVNAHADTLPFSDSTVCHRGKTAIYNLS